MYITTLPVCRAILPPLTPCRQRIAQYVPTSNPHKAENLIIMNHRVSWQIDPEERSLFNVYTLLAGESRSSSWYLICRSSPPQPWMADIRKRAKNIVVIVGQMTPVFLTAAHAGA